MKKSIGLALVPVLLAVSVSAFAADPMQSQYTHREMRTTTTTTSGNMQTFGQTQDVTPLQFGSDTQGQLALGQWQLVQKNYPEAIRIFNQVLSTNPSHPRALEGSAIAHYMNGDQTQALSDIQRAIAVDPINGRLFLTQAKIYDAQSKQPQALESYLNFLSLAPTDSNRIEAERRANDLYQSWQPRMTEAQRNYYNGLRSVAFGDAQQAVPVLQQYVSANPTVNDQYINANRALGMAYEQLNRPTEAVTVWETINKAQPQDPVAYYHLSTGYDQVGRAQNAREAWSNFIKYAPNSEATLYTGQPGFTQQHSTTTTTTETEMR